MLRPITDRNRRQLYVLLVAIVLLASAGVRLWDLARPSKYMFDEIYYAKDAKAIVDGHVGPKPGPYPWWPGDEISWPHPELGKMLIASGVRLFGDRAFGWRLPSVVAGMLLLACVYPLARRLGLPPPWALLALLFAAADPLGIAQSRISMLDIFVGFWTVLCIYLTLRYAQDGRRSIWLLAAGAAGGAALSTKWSGALALVAAALLLLVGWAWQRLTAQRDVAVPEADPPSGAPSLPAHSLAADPQVAAVRVDAGERRSTGAALALVLAAFVALPALIYLGSYTQYFLAGHSWAEWRELQRQMYIYNLHLKAKHPYASKASTWIIDYRPIWYYFKDTNGMYRGIVAIGNPFLWWLSIAGVVVGVVLAALRRSYLLLPTIILVASLYLPWFGASRTSFLYYMTPVAPFLAILVAGLLLVFARTAKLPRYGAWVIAGAAVATAALWDPIAAAAERHMHVAPASAPMGAGWAAVRIGVVAAAIVLTFLLMADTPRVRAARPYITMMLAGAVIGIVVAFIPVVLALPITPEHWSHIIWFRSWR